MDDSKGRLAGWLARTGPVSFSAYAIVAAFFTYFSMYAFRKPFAAAAFEGSVTLPGLPPMDLKILFIISQVLGYCLSKFAGIKIIAEMDARHRAWTLIGCIGAAEAALFLFAVVPPPYNALCLFLNGLPLGLVWGLVFGFLEGRRVSEGLGAGLSASYIVASGIVKSVGLWVEGQGVNEFWMPFVTGLIFLPGFLVCVFLLSRLPEPNAADQKARIERGPMDRAARRAFMKAVAPGLIPLTVLYFFLTAYRDFRDNFAREIWEALGHAGEPLILATSEIWIALGVLTVLASIMGVKDNRKALLVVHAVMAAGPVLVGLSTLLYQAGLIEPATWMILVGLGLYVAYVPFGCVLFDRMIAAVGIVGTAGFFIYVTDAVGYLGSVALMLYKNFGHAELSWLEFFIQFSYGMSLLCGTGFLLSAVYFSKATRGVSAPLGVDGAAPVPR